MPLQKLIIAELFTLKKYKLIYYYIYILYISHIRNNNSDGFERTGERIETEE